MRAGGDMLAGILQGISTGIATIFVESSSGENMIVIVGGANTRLTGEDVRKAEKEISESALVVTTLELDLETVRVALETGRSHGVTTILNAAPGRADLEQEILSNVDILVGKLDQSGGNCPAISETS